MKSFGYAFIATLAAAAVGLTPVAQAWEAQSTHVGITEQAALATKLHDELIADYGLELGLMQPLAVPAKDATALHEKLKLLTPTDGIVPDGAGRLSALGWLLAGAALEDVPATLGKNHFYDPVHDTGLHGEAPARTLSWMYRWFTGGDEYRGVKAPDWILAQGNELGVARFWLELEAAATAPTAAERERHLAFALVVAGATLHVLEDVGSPSRARNDLYEHFRRLGDDGNDFGSRFERLAALAFGRLGVPAPTKIEQRAHLRDFFSGPPATPGAKTAIVGLADVTAARWFSSGTLPDEAFVGPQDKAEVVTKRTNGTLRFPSPSLTTIDLSGARIALDGVRLRDERGVCMAAYRLDEAHLRWSIPDDCAVEQIATILPEVGGYAAGLLEFLFRGRLAIVGERVETGDVALGKGTLRFFAEDDKGVRRPLGPTLAVEGAKARSPLAAAPALPADARVVVAVYKGADAAGEALVAVGQTPPPPKPAPAPAVKPEEPKAPTPTPETPIEPVPAPVAPAPVAPAPETPAKPAPKKAAPAKPKAPAAPKATPSN